MVQKIEEIVPTGLKKKLKRSRKNTLGGKRRKLKENIGQDDIENEPILSFSDYEKQLPKYEYEEGKTFQVPGEENMDHTEDQNMPEDQHAESEKIPDDEYDVNDMSSEDDELPKQLLGSESDSTDGDDQFNAMVERSKQLDQEKEEMEKDADAEFEHMMDQEEGVELLQKQEENKESVSEMGIMTEDIHKIHTRILENLRVLSNFKKYGEEGFTRQDYITLLKEDLTKYYGYIPELIDYFLTIFSPAELVEFLEANEAPRPVTLRTNSLKARRKEVAESLIARGVNLDPLDRWSKTGLKVYDSKVPVGATPEYLAGQYIIQGASSFLPVIALNPRPKDFVLDMSAAPGGKTTYCASLMKNTGILFANDPQKQRTKGLIGNLFRMGVRNAIVFNHDGQDLPRLLPKMDKVLLDAPCTGLGVISRDPSVKTKRTLQDIRKMSDLQKKLILAAIDCAKNPEKLKGPVYIVYSTCSISPEENEAVIEYALRKRYVKIVPTGIPEDLGRDGYTRVSKWRFNQNMKLARRIYPHVHNMDGFFVCKLQKVKDGAKMTEDESVLLKKRSQKKKEKAQKVKAENLRAQKEREEHNKKLLQAAIVKFKGNKEAAKNWMIERKKEIIAMPGRKNLRPKKKRDQWN